MQDLVTVLSNEDGIQISLDVQQDAVLQIGEMMQEIQEQNENVSAAISIFNRNVEAFNNQIEVFPNNMINTMTLSKKPIRPFRDPIINQSYSYRPNF